MPQLIRTCGLAAVALSVAAVTACSSTEAPSATITHEPVTEDAAETAPPQPTSEADTTAAQPSGGTDIQAEQPSRDSGDVPEGYYVVDNGRAAVPERGGAGCEGLPSLEPRSNDTDERVFGYWYSGLRDVGPIDHATGEAVHDEDGRPVAYVAAPGDTMSGIAARFCIDYYPYLEWINAIRRGEGTSVMGTGSMSLYAGDTVNLDPYTIATVGDENGVVRDNAIDFHIPPQH